MSNGGEAQLDAHVVAVIPKEIAGELGSVIGDDPIRNAESCHQILDELERRILVGFHDRSCLRPLCQLVDRHVQPFITPDGFWERSQNIEHPNRERP